MNKTYRCSPDVVFGPRIFIDLPLGHYTKEGWAEWQEVRKGLDALSTWGGSTSNSPHKYLMWEFPSDGKNYAKAIALLQTSGWMAVKD